MTQKRTISILTNQLEEPNHSIQLVFKVKTGPTIILSMNFFNQTIAFRPFFCIFFRNKCERDPVTSPKNEIKF